MFTRPRFAGPWKARRNDGNVIYWERRLTDGFVILHFPDFPACIWCAGVGCKSCGFTGRDGTHPDPCDCITHTIGAPT